MLNKIRVVGKVLPIELEEKSETGELLAYFSLLVNNPNDVRTVLRCHARGEIATELEKEVRKEEILEVRGYLQNEKEGRQIIIRVLEFSKLESSDGCNFFNQAQLLGKIITDLAIKENNQLLSFKLEVSTKENKFNSFFCRVQGELVSEIVKYLKRGDVVLLEGFLQTKKINSDESIYPEKIFRISSFICQSFFLINKVSVNNFTPLDKLVLISKETEKIDFTKPRKEKMNI